MNKEEAIQSYINWAAWKDGPPLPNNPITRAYLAKSCLGNNAQEGRKRYDRTQQVDH